MLRRVINATAAAGSLAASAYVLADKQQQNDVRALADGFTRFCRTAYHGTVIVMDYKRNVDPLEAAHGKKSPEVLAAKKVVDLRSAQRLLELCRKHGGLYIKFAQVLATYNVQLPREYTETLAAAQDRAQAQPWEAVSGVFEEEIGRRPEDVFASVDTQPVGAASLAQVHHAVTRDGREVAIKIQYPHVKRQVESDMRAMAFFARAIETLWPDFGYTWFIPELEATVRAELNFLQEAHNGERVAAMFGGDKHVHIPAVYRDLSSERVLVQEYIKGCRVDDKPALAALAIPPQQLAATAIRFVSDQVHVHGFVHCDMHAGNLLARRHPTDGHWQLVVLDHGMYRKLTPLFRAAYCRLWKALVTGDAALGRRATEELGLETSFYDALSLMLTFRSTSSQAALGSKMSKEDIARLKEEYSGVNSREINRFMQRLPRDFLFVMRASNMVRALNKNLGGSSKDRFLATGESAIRGLTLTDAMDDFSRKSKEFAAKQQQKRQVATASIVIDTPGAEAKPSGAGGLGSLLLDWIRGLRGAPPHEPLTYLNVLSSNMLHTAPTESELQAAAVRSGTRQLRASWEITKLRWWMWALDAYASALIAMGYFSPHDGMEHEHKEPG